MLIVMWWSTFEIVYVISSLIKSFLVDPVVLDFSHVDFLIDKKVKSCCIWEAPTRP